MNAQPELKILATRIQSSRARALLASRDIYPDFELVAGYDSFWDREEQRFTVGVGVNIPLDRTKRRAAADEYRALMKQAEKGRIGVTHIWTHPGLQDNFVVVGKEKVWIAPIYPACR